MIGQKIKKYRTKRGMTQKELANKINRKRALISRYETGDLNNMPIQVLVRIAKALSVSPLELMKS